MYLMIIGVAFSGLGLVAAAMTSRGRPARIAAACVGAVGVLLLLAAWLTGSPPTNQAERIRSRCRYVAMRLESFDAQRTVSPPIWTPEKALANWDGLTELLSPIAEICIENTATCDRPLATNPMMETFSTDLAKLTDAIRTGKPCKP